jgi:hypothetical protein
MADSGEDYNEPSGSISNGEFLAWLRDWKYVNKDSIPWPELFSPSARVAMHRAAN